MADMPNRIASLISGSSALTTLASQAQPVHAHQSKAMINTPRSRPVQVRSWAMKAVTWSGRNEDQIEETAPTE
jgi:hypothetical protein